jgi:uncharacterized protein (TIGR02145 family)
MKTNFFKTACRRATANRAAARIAPTLFIIHCSLFIILWPAMLAAQNGVAVTGLVVNAGTVTFNVSWNKSNVPAVWSDTVWVFVDYNDAGVMKRLPLSTGATLAATSVPGVGKVVEISGNTDGIWVVGNARSAGSFSATVQLLTSTANIAGACVYASNYPPVGDYATASTIKFTGTPPYKIVTKDNGGNTHTWNSDSPFPMPSSHTVESFTDKTGAPGILKCVSATVYDLKVSATEFCSGTTVTFALSNTVSGRTYRLYKGGTVVMDALAGTGNAATFTGTFAGAGVYTAQAMAEVSHCGAVMNGSHTITERNLPTAPTIGKPTDVCYNTGNLMFTASGYSGVVEWTSNGGGTANNNTVTFASGAATGTKTVNARSAQTYTMITCYSGTATQSATVIPNPVINTQPVASTAICANSTASLSVVASPITAYQWKKNNANVADGIGGTSANYTTAALSGNATYSVIIFNGSCSVTSNNALVTVNTPPSAPTGLSSNISTICNGVATAATLTASGGSLGSGAVYEWGTGSTVGSSVLSTTTAATRSVSPDAATTCWVRLKGTGACSATTTAGATTSIATYAAVSAGSIQTAATTTKAGTNPGVTVANLTAASGGSGNLSYQWRRTGTSSATLTGSDATYTLSDDVANYAAAGTYYFNRYAKDAICNMAWMAATGTYTLTVESLGTYQPQGGCTYSEPAALTTFAGFDKDYSASTYVSLTDERDNKNYPVVKIGGRWIMARNLNYQEGLTWEANSNSPSTVSGSGSAIIGSFWCPGISSATTSIRASCDVWGALYSWKTAMMLDGKWTSSTHNSSAWNERTGYGAATVSANTQNHGQSDDGATTGGRGICPPNWHVPTDGEWGDMLDSMETGTKNHNTAIGVLGTDAGLRGKSKCTVPDNSTSGTTYVNDTRANWYYNSSALGTDVYGFRMLPAGYRNDSGYFFNSRGSMIYLWSSSAGSESVAWGRFFYDTSGWVGRRILNSSHGFSVRCIRDL